ncbi:amidohydrolase family protein [Demequina sp.]|uniref:amidohydrolase family protein n=1 Tax=Demequina sp. TaxID=2050685 RepID=UPI0025DE905A|nr:amidohydrolase family protein [Demequina sp.]
MTALDVIVTNGRVIDPESGLDGIRHVGIRGGEIVAVSESPLVGEVTVDASGLTVAPGFIDLHSHTQSIAGDRIQAFDGVTTALELESGIMPIGTWYDSQASSGRAINYGASVAWTFARVAELNPELGDPDGTLTYFQRAFGHPEWSTHVADQPQVDAILARIEQGLREGGIGVGINNGYAPGAGVQEMAEVCSLAARYGVPTFTHISYMANVDPDSSFQGYLRLIAYAATTGAHMHICHLNSTSLRDIERCATAIREAQAAGLKITTEAYPYGAGSTLIGAAMFLDPDFRKRTGSDWSDIVVNATGEAIASEERLRELQAEDPGNLVVWHYIHPETNEAHQKMLDMSNLYPGAAIASDAMPWAMPDGSFVDEDVWPIPDEAVAHPRSAGTYARFISQYVNRLGKITLMEAIEKCSLIPAQILEESTPQMKRKGRLQVGKDADLIVFDANEVEDKATFQHPTIPSTGMRHVIVNGVRLISNGELDTNALPGKPVRRQVK